MLKRIFSITPLLIAAVSITACSGNKPAQHASKQSVKHHKPASIATSSKNVKATRVVYEKRRPKPARRYSNSRKRTTYSRIQRSSFANKLSNAALNRLRSRVTYNGAYLKIGYPWGDVPANIGVCTDVVVRSYRKLGIDLQKEVHEDMSVAFNTYPNPRKWGLSKPDTNIDHRRVYNLRKFFTRKGAALPITRRASDYRPGDLVTWMVGPGLPHIGVVVNKRSKADPSRFMIVHNIARGPQIEDVLFRFPITGHYRYTSAHVRNKAPRTLYAARSNNRRNTSRVDAMNLGLLHAASSRLNTSSRSGNVAAISKDYKKLLNASAATKSRPVQSKPAKSIVLANLNNHELSKLLKK